MKILFLSLAVAQVVLANRDSTSDDDDSITGPAGINSDDKNGHSSAFQTNSQQSSTSAKVPIKKPQPPTVALAKPRSPKVKLTKHPEVFAIRNPEIVTVAHPSAYIAHHVLPEVHFLGDDDHHHLDVLQLSNGLQAVPLDDPYGHVSDYLYLGSEINLVPGSDSFYLPATDPIDGHTTYVNLGTDSGHLSLSEIRIGNTIQQGFEGVDEDGPVFIPVKRKYQRLVVNPVVYRPDRLSFYKSSSSSQFSSSLPVATSYSSYTSSIDDSPLHHIVF